MTRSMMSAAISLVFGLTACLSQTTTVCLPTECAKLCGTKPPDAGTEMADGMIYVVPEWADEHSGPLYVQWMKDAPENVAAFNQRLKQVIANDLGVSFPTVVIPAMSPDLARALATSGDAFRLPLTRDELLSARSSVRRAAAPDTARNKVDDIALAVHSAIHRHNTLLSTTYPADPTAYPSDWLREISYVIEHGVTYCVYGTYVARFAGEAGEWWNVSYPDIVLKPEDKATAYLNIYVVVRRVD